MERTSAVSLALTEAAALPLNSRTSPEAVSSGEILVLNESRFLGVLMTHHFDLR
jgi:hypothetical protein